MREKASLLLREKQTMRDREVCERDRVSLQLREKQTVKEREKGV